jgi:hypothetical protein
MPAFLSEEWFARVEELTRAAGELQVPKAIGEVVVNLYIETSSGEVPLCMHRGAIRRGEEAQPDVRMWMPAEYAYRILVAGEWSAGMKGYIARKIRLSGNMRKLIPLQVFKPSAAQDALRRQIEGITDPPG